MAEGKPFKIGVITNLENGQNRLGSGIVSSCKYGIERYCRDHHIAPANFEILIGDDFGQASSAYARAKEFFEAGAIAIIGPSDSQAAQQVLENTEFGRLPFVITFATASHLAEYGTNMFRTTNNDRRRAEHLINEIRNHVDVRQKVSHFALVAPTESYAYGLAVDVEAALDAAGIPKQKFEFTRNDFVPPPIARHSPIVVSAPSAEGAELVKKLRLSGHCGPIFGFGSNSNWLRTYCRGVIVISDLDRASGKLRIKDELAGFFNHFPKEREPSLATMNGAYALVDAIVKSGVEATDDLSSARARLHETLMDDDLNGIFGPIRFEKKNGELIGEELLGDLQVNCDAQQPMFVNDVDYSKNCVESYWNRIRRFERERPWIRWVGAGILGTAGIVADVLGIFSDGGSMIFGP